MTRRRIILFVSLLGLLTASFGYEAAAAGSAPGDALARLARDSTRPLVVRTDPGENVPSFVTGRIPVADFSDSDGPAARGWDFWKEYGRAFGVDEARAELVLHSVERDDLGMTHLTYDQRYRGLPVFGRQLLLHFDGSSVTVVNGEFTPDIGVTTSASVSAAQARAAAEEVIPSRGRRSAARSPQLLVHVDAEEQARLAWRVTVGSTRPLGVWQVFVDTRTGESITFYNDLHTAKVRQIHTNGNDPDCNTQDAPACTLPGTLARNEGGAATGDAVVDDNYTHVGTTYDYFSTNFSRDSYDGAGHAIRSTVHFGSGYNNAFWCDDVCASFFGSTPDGEQVVFGDGDGAFFSSLARDIDVVSHEIAHGLTNSEANLTYQSQSGALNESYSDVFAAMVDTGDWLIGEDSFTPGTPGDALRSMSDPSSQGQPEHMSEYEETVYDAGGVHINSGIPNHAAYLTSEGPGYGIGRPATQQIYYRALTTYLTASSDFLDNLNALLQSAVDLFPGDATKTTAVARAQAAVGIVNPPAVTFPNGGESIPAGSGTNITWTSNDHARPFKVSYLEDMGSTVYFQDFETGIPGEYTGGGNAPWTWSTVDPAPGGGVYNVRSGVIGNNQRSELSLNVRLPAPGSMSFRYRVSSEPNFDFLSFHVDGEQQFSSSGNVPWATNTESLTAGTHALNWVYEKDGSVVGGSDLARIDDISISDVENVSLTTVSPATVPGASSQPWTTPETSGSNFKVRVETLGVAPWYSTDDSNAVFSVTGGPPETTITSGPTGLTNDSTPTFEFTSSVPDSSTFECWVDSGTPAVCSSPHTTEFLSDGSHTFNVQATAGGNTDPSPATRSFTVDADPPETTITSGPTGPTDDSTPTFTFESDESGSTFSCRVDSSNPFTGCTSPHTTEPVSSGVAHIFEVRATDPASNTDPTPASRLFVVTVPPPPAPVPSMSISDAKKKETDRGKKAMKFTVSLSQASSSPVTVSFATKNGTAKAPKDFKSITGTLTFAPGTTSQAVKVLIKGDVRDEKNEKFSVLLSGPSGANIADGTATGTIKDND